LIAEYFVFIPLFKPVSVADKYYDNIGQYCSNIGRLVYTS